MAVAKKEIAIVEQAAPLSMDAALANLVANPNLPVERAEQAFALYQKMKADAARQEFSAAMNAAQMEMGRISADATNPQTRSKYASYAALDRALRPIYTKHGFSISYNTDPDHAPADHVRVLATLRHVGGHQEPYTADMPADGKGAKGGDVMTKTHAAGSGMTYGQRYLLKLMWNVAIGENDDDGNGAHAPAANGCVSEKQSDVLLALLKNNKALETRVLAWVGKMTGEQPATVSDIPAKLFDRVVANIKAAR